MFRNMLQESSWWTFFKGFVRSPRSVGSIAPSSRALVTAMLDAANVDQARFVVEFGPGTGVFTEEIVRRLRPDAQLLVFEIEPKFLERLRSRIADPRVTLIAASAADVQEHLTHFGGATPDSIISGLPFTSLPRPLTNAILSATVQALSLNGVFVTYQYTPLLRNVLRAHFPNTRITRIVFRNLPPALVFVCRPLV